MNTPQHPLLVLSVINSNSDRYGNLFVFLDERQMQKDIIQLLNNASMEFYLFPAICLWLATQQKMQIPIFCLIRFYPPGIIKAMSQIIPVLQAMQDIPKSFCANGLFSGYSFLAEFGF